jgi:lipopolysaccharide transport system ATP-binding protein
MSYETVISVDNLSKNYEIYATPGDRLKQLFLPKLRNTIGLNHKSYCSLFPALSNVSFSISQGETFGIVGKNGSGKSTLLQMLCGTLAASSGKISVKGKVAALLELGAGFNPEFTGRENVYMNGRLFGLSNKEIDARFDLIAAFADIGDFIEKPVKTYSSGMYVRLAFAVIAHVDADILIVDEALSVGDAYFVQKCMRFLRQFMDKGTLLFVSHDIGAVTNLCSRALWLEKGCVKEIGKPKEIVKHYLEGLVSDSQDIQAAKSLASNADVNEPENADDFIDMRDEFINKSTLRNDIQVLPFQAGSAAFGAGGAQIVDASLIDPKRGNKLAYLVGGEKVRLQIRAKILEPLDGVILGFDLKDRLGQTIFGDNTYLTYELEPIRANNAQHAVATFDFKMPLLPVGDYAITVAIATGSQTSHVQQHWIHDAIVFHSQASRVGFGLIGVPMQNITISIT